MDTVPSNQNPTPTPSDTSVNTPKPVNQQPVSSPPPLSTPPPQTPPPQPLTSVSLSSKPPSEIPQGNGNKTPFFKKDINFLNKALFVLGPLIMVGLFGVSLFNLTKAPKTPIQAPAKPVETIQVAENLAITKKQKENWDKWLDNIPKNPDQVIATCLSTGQTLTSGQPTSCSDPEFKCTGEESQEQETQIEGFYVYFGEKKDITTHPNPGYLNATDPQKEGAYQESNTYTPSNLERGKTYYLFVQAVSDSSNPGYKVGYSVVDRQTYKTRPADILFEYIYE